MPDVERNGDVWLITWPEHGVGIGIERLRESRESLKAEITATNESAGRVQGPNNVDLLSARSQAEYANGCAERVNSLTKAQWHAIVIHACALVARDYRKPTPTVRFSSVADKGPVKYVDGTRLLPQSETTVMYGDGESAKSLLAMRIAFSIATGYDVPWGAEVASGNVLYCDWETNEDTQASRLRRIAQAMQVPVPDNMFYKQCFRSLDDELPDIREQIARERITFVVVDSIGFAASGALVEDQTARSAMNSLRLMSPATRLVIAHVSKQAAISTGPRRPFGSQFFWNGMRSGIEVSRSEESTTDNLIDLGVYHRKSNDGRHAKPFGLSVIFGDDESILFDDTEISEVPDLAQRAPLVQRIRDRLRHGAQAPDELADELGRTPADVIRALNRMSGVVELGRGGKWGLSG